MQLHLSCWFSFPAKHEGWKEWEGANGHRFPVKIRTVLVTNSSEARPVQLKSCCCVEEGLVSLSSWEAEKDMNSQRNTLKHISNSGYLSTSGQLLPWPDSRAGTVTELPDTNMRSVSDIYVDVKVPSCACLFLLLNSHLIRSLRKDRAEKQRPYQLQFGLCASGFASLSRAKLEQHRIQSTGLMWMLFFPRITWNGNTAIIKTNGLLEVWSLTAK